MGVGGGCTIGSQPARIRTSVAPTTAAAIASGAVAHFATDAASRTRPGGALSGTIPMGVIFPGPPNSTKRPHRCSKRHPFRSGWPQHGHEA